MSPDLLLMGRARRTPPSSDRSTPMYWALPWLAPTASARTAGTAYRRRMQPWSRSSRGRTNSCATKNAAAGCPGRPKTGLPPALPRSVGLPGFMATPWKSTSPQSSRTRLTASLVPTEVPPEISTISHTASARSSVRRRRISSSPRAPKPAAVPPASSTSARSMVELTSRTCPSPGVSATGTSSSPVEMIPTTGLRHTVTAAAPRAASAPISWLASRRPAGSTTWPGRTSSPLKIRLAPGAAGLQTPMAPSP